MAYIGSTPTSQNFTSGTDYFSGTGSQTAFTLTRTVNSVNDIEVVINNVVQQPSTAYTLSGTTITFTSAPSSGTNNIYVRYLATNMQSFTVPANSISHTHLDSNLQAGFQGRNKIINGSMVVDQRNAGASVSSGGSFPVDRFYITETTSATFTAQRSTTAPVGFTNSLLFTVGTGASAGASEQVQVRQQIEGYNISDLAWGTANAKTVTLSFQARASIAGTYCVFLQDTNATLSYVAEYTISSANTWEQKSVTITGPTTGTFDTTNSTGVMIAWDLGSGSNFNATAGVWQSAVSARRTTNQTNLVGTSGATFYITGVQLEEGTTATSFEREAYSVTLDKCKRYCQKLMSGILLPKMREYDRSRNGHIQFIPQMRATPTVASMSSTDGVSISVSSTTDRGCALYMLATSDGMGAQIDTQALVTSEL